MALAAPLTVTSYAGETIDALVWRALAKGPGAVEQILDANPGLAAIAEAMPEGTPVIIPMAADAAELPSRSIVQLWDD